MAQEAYNTELSNNVAYTWNSTTDATTITLSDDQFAHNLALQELTAAIKKLTSAIRELK
jgi:hypothetical protein